jgi:ATP-dependent DNA helicase RecG
VDNCIKQGLPEPDFVEENGVMTVTFYKDKWNQENLRKLGLNVRQVKAVMYVKKNGKITNSDYQELNDVSERTALRDLEALIKKEVLMKKGEKRRPIINWVMADKWRIWRISGG